MTPIDLAPFRLGTAQDRLDVAAQLDAAGRGSGFFSITGHGIDADLIAAMLEVTSRYFDLPVAAKLDHVVADTAANRGYAPEGSEALAYSIGETDLPPDLFEAFNVGRELTDEQLADAYFATYRQRYFAPNLWPEQLPEMRDVWLAYWAGVEALGLQIMSAAALALGLPDDHFVGLLDRSISVMRANNYQRRAGAAAPGAGQMRMGAHTDYGSITVLLADRVPGLQLRAGGEWHDVLPPQDGFLVNIGDLLAEWTNDRWHSTMHRVLPPPSVDDGPVRRRSIAWFQQPNWDAVIECLPNCRDEANPARYQAVTSGDHLMAKLMGPRLLRPSETTPAHGG